MNHKEKLLHKLAEEITNIQEEDLKYCLNKLGITVEEALHNKRLMVVGNKNDDSTRISYHIIDTVTNKILKQRILDIDWSLRKYL